MASTKMDDRIEIDAGGVGRSAARRIVGGSWGRDRRRAIEAPAMIPMANDVKVWLATGHTDMRKGFSGLALQVQEALRRDPMRDHLFVFRGRRGDLLKVVWHDGQSAARARRHTGAVIVPMLRLAPTVEVGRGQEAGKHMIRWIIGPPNETLEVIPRRWKVIQTVRARFACRACDVITQP